MKPNDEPQAPKIFAAILGLFAKAGDARREWEAIARKCAEQGDVAELAARCRAEGKIVLGLDLAAASKVLEALELLGAEEAAEAGELFAAPPVTTSTLKALRSLFAAAGPACAQVAAGARKRAEGRVAVSSDLIARLRDRATEATTRAIKAESHAETLALSAEDLFRRHTATVVEGPKR